MQGGTGAGHLPPMDINELTDLTCDACGEAVDVLGASFEPVVPTLCEPCLGQLAEDESRRAELPVAA
jgi:hypothetical protein